ncbi:MAG: hypothetical protein Q9180_009089, partial [Flavoplaca navasiana]
TIPTRPPTSIQFHPIIFISIGIFNINGCLSGATRLPADASNAEFGTTQTTNEFQLVATDHPPFHIDHFT